MLSAMQHHGSHAAYWEAHNKKAGSSSVLGQLADYTALHTAAHPTSSEQDHQHSDTVAFGGSTLK